MIEDDLIKRLDAIINHMSSNRVMLIKVNENITGMLYTPSKKELTSLLVQMTSLDVELMEMMIDFAKMFKSYVKHSASERRLNGWLR